MSRDRQPSPPTYEGRRLPRPGDEVVDQGLSFDIETLLGRRQMLRLFGVGAATLGLAACGVGSGGSGSNGGEAGADGAGGASPTTGPSPSGSVDPSLAEIPDETAGPFPGDGTNGPDILERSGVVRSDIRSSFAGSNGTAEGVPMTLELTIRDLAQGTAFAGAAVYVWHCDREGRYSMYSSGAQDQNYLRGVQVADADGRVRFTSIFPACYSGRWPHIHFEVYPDEASIVDAGNVVATSQVALPEGPCSQVYAEPGYEDSVRTFARVSLESDGVFGEDDGASQLGTVTGDVASGYVVSLVVGVDTRTTPAGGGMGRAPSGAGRPGGARS